MKVKKTMNSKEFYKIVKKEGLDKYNISDSKESRNMANVVGIAEDNGWVVFETDEKATFHVLSKHESQEDAYRALLEKLRNRKRKEDILWK